MADFPILLRLDNRLCIVVGGGPVGRRKAQALRDAGARVRLIAPDAATAAAAGIEVEERNYRPGDLQGAFLAVAATGEREVNAAVVREARAARVLVNVADAPEEGDFALPALLRRGDLTVAVSSAGRSPALAAFARDRVADALGPEWAAALEIAAAIRLKKLTLPDGTEYNREILRRLLAGGLLSLIAEDRTADIDRLLTSLCGEECSVARLGIELAKGET